jgi:hypothetical protein
MRTIEEIIKTSETAKEISVSDVAWRRLERKLDRRDHSVRFTRVIYRSIAAVAAVIFLFLLLPIKSGDNNYHTSELKANTTPLFTKDEVSSVNKLFPDLYVTGLNG